MQLWNWKDHRARGFLSIQQRVFPASQSWRVTPSGSHWPWPSIFWVKSFLWRGQEKETKFFRRKGPVGCFPNLVPTFPRVSISISLCFLGFFQMLTSDIPREATLGERWPSCGESPWTDKTQNRALQHQRCWPPPFLARASFPLVLCHPLPLVSHSLFYSFPYSAAPLCPGHWLLCSFTTVAKITAPSS